MQREIRLDGGEVAIIKALGLSGTGLNGKMLLERSGNMEFGEFIDTLSSLMTQGYILANKVTVQSEEDVERAAFRVNPSYARDLRDAMRPGGRRHEESRRRHRG
jgi:hypothetical protein